MVGFGFLENIVRKLLLLGRRGMLNICITSFEFELRCVFFVRG
jgi:hypothetical protein